MTTASARWYARRHRGLFWSAVLLAVLAVVGGAIVAVVGVQSAAGPDRVVTGYFSALARADAPAALGYGDLPAGPRTLLTSAVLQEQQRAGAIRDFDVLAVERSGDTARVSVRYELAFSAPDGGPAYVVGTVPVRKSGDSWRLTATAVPVRLHLAASERATLADGAVPARTVLLFPGALPLQFDSPYLQLAPASRYVSFDSPADTTLRVQVSPAGERAAQQAVSRSLETCFTRSDNTAHNAAAYVCPLPSDRYVPGSLKGTVSGLDATQLTVTVGKDPAGVVSIAGTATFTGGYQRLTYDNVARPGSGSLAVPVHARAYAVAPLRVHWVQQ